MKEKIKNIFENILVSVIVIGIVLFLIAVVLTKMGDSSTTYVESGKHCSPFYYLNSDQCVPLFDTWFIVGIAFVIVLVLTILIYFYFNLGKIKFREEIY